MGLWVVDGVDMVRTVWLSRLNQMVLCPDGTAQLALRPLLPLDPRVLHDRLVHLELIAHRLPKLLRARAHTHHAAFAQLGFGGRQAEGVRIELGAECLSLSRQQGPQGERIVVGAACAADAPPIVGSHVLLAVGRRPNTDGLGLELAGVKTDERGFVAVDEQCRSSAEGVWAVGDCNGRGAFTHTSWNDHEIVVANLFDSDPRRIADRIPCYALFIDPPLGRIGATEREVRASVATSGRPALRATMPMQRVGRAREAGETQGFMKVLVDAESRKLLGAAILGMNGDEVVHALLDMMVAGQPVDVIARTMHIHPTVSELVPTLLQQLKPLG